MQLVKAPLSHPSPHSRHLSIQDSLPDVTEACPWPAGTSGPASLAEDKPAAQGPVQIVTVGHADHAQDVGETAAGGGARPSGQDLRATMQRKGEPQCRGPD